MTESMSIESPREEQKLVSYAYPLGLHTVLPSRVGRKKPKQG